MGWWSEQVVPRATDVVLSSREVAELRRRVCSGLAGEVLEIGFGSGLNVEHYPPTVRRVAAVEPSDVAWRIAEQRHLDPAAPQVTRAGLDGQRIDLPTASCDSALSTFTLCTIPDLDAVLAEVARVVRPGGAFHFLEHGLSPDPGVARWQRRLTPVQRRVGAGCHLDRAITDRVRGSGLVLQEVENFYLSGLPGVKVFGYLYLGLAVKE